jgi:hypothetical protein
VFDLRVTLSTWWRCDISIGCPPTTRCLTRRIKISGNQFFIFKLDSIFFVFVWIPIVNYSPRPQLEMSKTPFNVAGTAPEKPHPIYNLSQSSGTISPQKELDEFAPAQVMVHWSGEDPQPLDELGLLEILIGCGTESQQLLFLKMGVDPNFMPENPETYVAQCPPLVRAVGHEQCMWAAKNLVAHKADLTPDGFDPILVIGVRAFPEVVPLLLDA